MSGSRLLLECKNLPAGACEYEHGEGSLLTHNLIFIQLESDVKDNGVVRYLTKILRGL